MRVVAPDFHRVEPVDDPRVPRWLLLLVAALCSPVVLLYAAHVRQSEPWKERPDLGTSPGEVRLVPQGPVSPGTQVTMDVEADPAQGISGGVCFHLSEWDQGWSELQGDDYIDGRTSETREIQDELAECPATGEPLPTSFTFTLPDLDDGIYQLSYRWSREGDDSTRGAGFIFSVDT